MVGGVRLFCIFVSLIKFVMSSNSMLLEKLSVPVSDRDMKAAENRRNGSSWLRKSRRFAVSVMHYLKEKDISNKELAERMGMPVSFVDKLLSGKENLSLETISKVEEALGTEICIIKESLKGEIVNDSCCHKSCPYKLIP